MTTEGLRALSAGCKFYMRQKGVSFLRSVHVIGGGDDLSAGSSATRTLRNVGATENNLQYNFFPGKQALHQFETRS